MRDRKWVDPHAKGGGEELGEAEGGKTIVRRYYMEKYLFSKKEKIK